MPDGHKAIICDKAAASTQSRYRRRRDPEIGEHAESRVEKVMGAMATGCRTSMRETKSHHRNLEQIYWWTEGLLAR